MIYLAYNRKLDVTLKSHFSDELMDMIEYEEWECGDYNIHEACECRGSGCGSTETQERFDFYGITTGHYCHDCYENNYPYRKDRYHTIEHDGFGERLNED